MNAKYTPTSEMAREHYAGSRYRNVGAVAAYEEYDRMVNNLIADAFEAEAQRWDELMLETNNNDTEHVIVEISSPETLRERAKQMRSVL